MSGGAFWRSMSCARFEARAHSDRLIRPDSSGLAHASRAIGQARTIVVLTGAGVSAESGIPTFRDADGLWGQYNPAELATPEGFRRDPRRVWEWYELRRRAVMACRPNAGHAVVARLLCLRPDVTLITQNVDGLHQRAIAEIAEEGDPPGRPADLASRILELHGNLLKSRCSECGIYPPEGEAPRPRQFDTRSSKGLPRCQECSALLRPDVVWFGEPLVPEVLDRAFEAARAADICIVAGTSAVVHPAASIPFATVDAGGVVVEVNTETTPLSAHSEWHLSGRASVILPEILKEHMS